MKREILFRGKRIDNGEWAEGDLLNKCSGSPKISIHGEYNRGLFVVDSYEVIPETVGEWTGLKDKNGKKIYIGDILQYNDNKYIIKESRLGWQRYQGDRHSTTMRIHKYEIIGTIFDKEEV